MKTKLTLTVLSAALLTNCAIFSKTSTTEQKVSEIRNLSYAASSIGTQIALKQNPLWREQFTLAYTSLDALVTSKTVTGALLRDIIAKLPVKELKSDTARIAIEGATVLYDASVGDKVNIENSPYVLAAATGIRDGMKIGLGL